MAARVPRPGGPVRGSTTGRALMAALDLLGRRWALRILWELRAEPLGARALQARCDRMSSSVLYERLAELTAAGLLARDEAGAYLLTDLGAALAPALESLDSWARRWAQILQETDRTPDTRDSLPRSSGPPHRARDTTGRSVKDLHPERTVVFRPPHRHGPADASPVTAGLPKPATGPWSPDRNCHPRARDRVYQAHGLVLRLGREDPMAQQQNHTHPVSAEVFRQVYDSPVSLPGRDRWLTSDEDVRKVEEILGMPQRTIGAPLWVSGDRKQCPDCGRETNWLDIVSSAVERIHSRAMIARVILGSQKFVNTEAPRAIAGLRCFECGASIDNIRSFKCHNWAYADRELLEVLQEIERNTGD